MDILFEASKANGRKKLIIFDDGETITIGMAQSGADHLSSINTMTIELDRDDVYKFAVSLQNWLKELDCKNEEGDQVEAIAE